MAGLLGVSDVTIHIHLFVATFGPLIYRVFAFDLCEIANTH